MQRRGWLKKKSPAALKGMQRRYFVLDAGMLVVARRPDLAKEKREILDACAAAAADVGGGASGVFADILPADGGAASGLLERMKEGGATASGLLKEGGAGLERMFSRGMKWLDEG